jgi:hypothetical protein
MNEMLKSACITLIFTLIISASVIFSTLALHEAGHYASGLIAGCKNIRLILFSSDLGSYTEMSCPQEQSAFFPVIGAFMLTTPFALSFLLLKKFNERFFIWVSLGFNLIISVIDVTNLLPLQILIFVLGIVAITFGEALIIDNILLFTRRWR